MKRAVVFAHYNPKNCLFSYIFPYLEELKNNSDKIIFVSTSKFGEVEYLKLKTIVSHISIRENIGYDFMSWANGLKQLNLEDYDEVILCNDSIIGPLFSLDDLFEKSQAFNCDFWGITNSFEIAEHIQSYFMVFRKPIFSSKFFSAFWKKIEHHEDKWDYILKYEIGLSQGLLNNGYTYKVISPYKYYWNFYALLRGLMWRPKLYYNPSIFFWKQTILNGCPFIKKEILEKNPLRINLKKVSIFIQDNKLNSDILKNWNNPST